MELSIFLAKVWGLYLVLISIAFLINKGSIRALLGIMDQEGAIVMSGALSLGIGVASVVGHNIWTGPAWVVVVTAFGWFALLKGVVRLAWPSRVRLIIEKLDASGALMPLLIIVLLIGLYLCYAGFTA